MENSVSSNGPSKALVRESQGLTIFLTPGGEVFMAFFWSRVCMSECRVNTWYLRDIHPCQSHTITHTYFNGVHKRTLFNNIQYTSTPQPTTTSIINIQQYYHLSDNVNKNCNSLVHGRAVTLDCVHCHSHTGNMK